MRGLLGRLFGLTARAVSWDSKYFVLSQGFSLFLKGLVITGNFPDDCLTSVRVRNDNVRSNIIPLHVQCFNCFSVLINVGVLSIPCFPLKYCVRNKGPYFTFRKDSKTQKDHLLMGEMHSRAKVRGGSKNSASYNADLWFFFLFRIHMW